jgi:serine/threonine protein kinase
MENKNEPLQIEELFKDAYKGKIKDKYHFCEKLSSGGFGIVYLAEDRKTK